jgi:hypothetical protein
MRHAITTTLLIFTFGSYNDARAQVVTTDQRVRLTSTRLGFQRQLGSVVSASADSVTVALTTDTAAIALADLDRLELSRPGGRRTGRGALLGLFWGAFTGLGVGLFTYQECVPSSFFDCLLAPKSQGEAALEGSVMLGILGTAIGTIAGALTHGERWIDVRVPRASPSLRSLPEGRVGVGLSLSF